MLRLIESHPWSRRFAVRLSIVIVKQHRTTGTQTILEIDQALIFNIGTSQIELNGAVRLRFLDRLPEQEGHSTQRIEGRIGAPVFVGGAFLELQGDQRSYWLAILGGGVNCQPIGQAVDQTTE